MPNQPYYVIACRQVTWKRVDLAIRACVEAGVPLVVIGDGAEHQNLVKLAGELQQTSTKQSAKNTSQSTLEGQRDFITFIPWLSSEDLAVFLHYAKGYIFPSEEPFGIAAVEALAAGCPVIAYAQGGSQDFIREGENGILFYRQEVPSLVKALQKFDQQKFQRKVIARSAEQFSCAHFRQAITREVNRAVESISSSHKAVSKTKNSPKENRQCKS